MCVCARERETDRQTDRQTQRDRQREVDDTKRKRDQERERERERGGGGGGGEQEKEKETESVCVCHCVGACVHACVFVCVIVCMCARVRTRSYIYVFVLKERKITDLVQANARGLWFRLHSSDAKSGKQHVTDTLTVWSQVCVRTWASWRCPARGCPGWSASSPSVPPAPSPALMACCTGCRPADCRHTIVTSTVV